MCERGLTILAIDDNADNLTSLRAVLADALPDGVLWTATDGHVGLALARDHDPHVILLDILMPDVDGFTVCRALKADDRMCAIPVVFLTSLQENREARAKAVDAGAEGFLSKPFDPIELTALIRTMAMVKCATRRIVNERDRFAALVVARTQELEIELEVRRAAELAALASEQKYKNLTENINEAVFTTGPHGIFTYISPSVFEQTGFTPAELVGRSMSALLHPDDVQRVTNLFQTQRGDGRLVMEFRFVTKDGRVRWARASNRFLTRDGQVQGLHGVVSDITANKLVEAEREQLATAIEHAAEMVVITDGKGVITYANPAFARTTGYSRQEVTGRTLSLLKSGVQGEAFYRTLWDTILDGRTWHGRMINRRKDGTLYTEESTIAPVQDEAGVISEFVAIKRDVTDELKMAARLFQSDRMEGMGRLAGGVAHDFNNLLSVILNHTALGLEYLHDGHPAREHLEQIGYAGKRATALTRHLQAFGRPRTLQPLALDVGAALAELLPTLRQLVGEHVLVVHDVAPDLGRIKVDPIQFEEVVVNLAVNARDAMPEGGTLTLAAVNGVIDAADAERQPGTNPGPCVVFRVRDSGTGMDRFTLDRALDPFFSTKDGGPGSGLGLSVVDGIVRQSGGLLSVTSEPGQGSEFRLHFPQDLSDVSQAADGPTVLSVAARHAADFTILLVEDEAPLRVAFKKVLESVGYRVLVAEDGMHGAAICGSHVGDIHLLLTDVVMPEMNGRVLADRFSVDRPACKIIFMSGYADAMPASSFTRELSTHFIAKPIAPTDLKRKVNEVLGGRVISRADAFQLPLLLGVGLTSGDRVARP
ncbi:MAG: PAS domain S-box protein [Myxococcota bacterium]